MSKFASFGFVILLFLLLSGVVFFGFFIFTPKIKAYRALNMELQQGSSDLSLLEQEFNKQYSSLRNLQGREADIDIALHRYFDQTQFQEFLQHQFASFMIHHTGREQNGDLLVNRMDVRAKIASPAEYYRFVDILNGFEWVVEVGERLQFKSVEDGIEAHFTLKVYTQAP
ncbi:MAG: hypothetical protein MUP09_07965 [Thiovulaceae bacterium]|nr:hypothetical protein [Sulfurimonadaceae bacterium]